MASDDRGYFVPTDDGLGPVSEASSPWSPDMLHGRLLAGLAARAVEEHPEVDPDLRLARLTVEMYRFPPMAPHRVTARVVRQGRRVGALDVSITAAGHITSDGLAIGTCTLYDLDGPVGWSSVCAVANEVMGSSS